MKHTKDKKEFHIDYFLLILCVCLLVGGFIMLTSASLHLGEKIAHNSTHYPVRQLLHIVLGIVVVIGVSWLPLRIWQEMGFWLFIGSIVLLIFVLIPEVGIKVNASTRWLELGGIRIQVAEIVKFTSIVYMASYFTRYQEYIQHSIYWLTKPLLFLFVICCLLLLQPDFGSVVIILAIVIGIMFIGGGHLGHIVLVLGVISLLLTAVAYFSPYRWARITIFINPWSDAQNSGFQLVQALISFGRGEIFGVGLGNGIQKLFYLPEAHTDFLFSIIAEELGLVGVIGVISLFTLLFCHCFYLGIQAIRVEEKFSAFIAYGVGIWFGFQAFINMGVNMGILPTKGLTLPFISYGGSSMIIMCLAIGLVFRVYSEITEKQKTFHISKV